MATVDPPIRTWDGNYGGDWFGSPYPWFGPRLGAAARGYLIEREPCDCCYTTCQCNNCLTFGYWDEYDITVPVPYGYYRYAIGAIGISAGLAYFLYTGPRTFTTTTMVSVANGILNNCCFEYLAEDIEFTYDSVDYTIDLLRITYCPNAASTSGDNSYLSITVVEPWVGVPSVNVSWTATFTFSGASTEEDCHDPPILTADNMDTGFFVPAQGQILNWYNLPGPPKTIEPAPSGTAVWTSCGTDDTGAPIVDPGGPGLRTEKVSGLPFVTVKKSLPVTAVHADRCDHYQGRAEKKAGCNGWRCKGKCDLGLPAVPGSFCQRCDKYEPDPDYMGQGVPGWLK